MLWGTGKKALKEKCIHIYFDNKQVDELETELDDMRTKWNETEEEVLNKRLEELPQQQREMIQQCFKNARVKPKGRRYNLEFIYECILLRIKSPKAYLHCLRHNLLPLPSFATLRRYMDNLDSAYGFNDKVFQCLKVKASEMRPNERRGMKKSSFITCILYIDHVHKCISFRCSYAG